ncbi:MAG: HAD family hydrolase [Sedimentisphaerales bacterium]|nr:HAD family hydrolase [Sedimentisphaerales bacterium]
MTIEAVIFDLDGTLTVPFLDFDQIRREIGLPDGMSVLEGIAAMTPAQRQKAESILLEHESRAAQNSKLNDGAIEILDSLRRRNLPIGLLTRNLRKNVMLVVELHGLHFDAIVDRLDGPVKPDGFGVRHLCERFGVCAAKTLVVGDFKHDLECAKNAGAIAVLIRTHHQADQFASLADFTIDRLDEILTIIDTIENQTRMME